MARITPRSQNQAKWYQEVVLQAELADYGPVRGTIVYRPYGYAIWELIQAGLNKRIKSAGVENAYFPLFIPYSFLEKEKQHVQGFAPELALVTHGGGKKLEEPLVVRPTSETIMYHSFAKWIQSYNDLPLMINQWNNVVRWEKRTLPFIRGLEFLWQEGHTAHATKAEADKEVMRAVDMYHDFVRDQLALYSVVGYKTETEKFSGADYTTTFEILLKDGKALQSGTSHMLGQNFSRSFKIQFLDKDGKLRYVWQTSWGMSTRIIGALILAHGDDKGLRLPPKIAPIQVVIVPIIKGDPTAVVEKCRKIKDQLAGWGIRVKLDVSDKTPGYKFNYWEVKGVPLRIEVGERELKAREVVVYRRDKGERLKLAVSEKAINGLLDDVQASLLKEHRDFSRRNIRQASSFEEMKKIIKEDKGFVKVFYKDNPEAETKIKEETGATARCIPLEYKDQTGVCFYSRQKGGRVTLFAKAY
ncbi:MAG: proline--tRNA ligase [bacterium]|nr:proline--tRNA ligase [bacterium]